MRLLSPPLLLVPFRVPSALDKPPPPPPLTPPSSWWPSTLAAQKLFVAGAWIGPLVDGLHNQCLLQYNVAPIIVDYPWLSTTSATVTTTAILSSSSTSSSPLYYEPHLFASSWIIPPLLGCAYIVLGAILPRILQMLIDATTTMSLTTTSSPPPIAATTSQPTTQSISNLDQQQTPFQSLNDTTTMTVAAADSPLSTSQPQHPRPSPLKIQSLGFRAALAVLSTAAIVKLSEYLIVSNHAAATEVPHLASGSAGGLFFEGSDAAEQYLMILITAAVVQWAYLDGTVAALGAASLAAILGPLSELPFVAAGAWTYLPEAGDTYTPLASFATASVASSSASSSTPWNSWFEFLWGDTYPTLALNSITGPCYFAVTMDAIALGRWLDAMHPPGSSRYATSATGSATTTGLTATEVSFHNDDHGDLAHNNSGENANVIDVKRNNAETE